MADLNALIAQGYQPQAPVDPFAQYAKMQQLNVGENQNALAQYQLAQAQRADVQANALNQAYASGVNPDTGEMDYGKVRRSLAAGGAGSQIPSLEKTRLEYEKSALEQKKLLGEIALQPVALARATTEAVDAQLKQSKERLNQIDPYSPNVGQQLLAWHQSNHQGLLGDTLRANGSTAEQTQGDIQAAVAGGPAAIAKFIQRSTLGQTEFEKSIAPAPEAVTDGKTKFFIDKNPKSPTFGRKIGGEGFAVGVSPDVSARLAFDQQKFAWDKANPGYQLEQDANGNFFGINKKTLQATPITVGNTAPAGAGRGSVGITDGGGVPFVGKSAGLTESQGNATAYGMRMKEANSVLTDLEKKGLTNTGITKGIVGGTVGIIPLIGDKLQETTGSIFNTLPEILGGLSPEQQQIANSRINFITAQLRKESGAAIGPSEFATAEKLYFPKPGDAPSVIAQKQKARDLAVKAMEIQAGPGAKNIQGYAPNAMGSSSDDPLGIRR